MPQADTTFGGESIYLSINIFKLDSGWSCLHLVVYFYLTPYPSPARTTLNEREFFLAGEGRRGIVCSINKNRIVPSGWWQPEL
jgi:hypothetical protein